MEEIGKKTTSKKRNLIFMLFNFIILLLAVTLVIMNLKENTLSQSSTVLVLLVVVSYPIFLTVGIVSVLKNKSLLFNIASSLSLSLVLLATPLAIVNYYSFHSVDDCIGNVSSDGYILFASKITSINYKNYAVKDRDGKHDTVPKFYTSPLAELLAPALAYKKISCSEMIKKY